MKKIIVAAATLCTAISLQGTITHTFINDSDLPIFVTMRYAGAYAYDTRRIPPFSKYTFNTPSHGFLRDFIVFDANKIKYVDAKRIKFVDKIIQVDVSSDPATSDRAFVAGDTQWKFTKDGSQATIELVSGGSYKKTVPLP